MTPPESSGVWRENPKPCCSLKSGQWRINRQGTFAAEELLDYSQSTVFLFAFLTWPLWGGCTICNDIEAEIDLLFVLQNSKLCIASWLSKNVCVRTLSRFQKPLTPSLLAIVVYVFCNVLNHLYFRLLIYNQTQLWLWLDKPSLPIKEARNMTESISFS